MSALTIDTLAVSQTLRKHGFTEEQSIGVVEALKEIDASELATKGDLRDLETKIDRVEAKIETTAANLRADIARWLFGVVLAIGGLMIAIEKVLK